MSFADMIGPIVQMFLGGLNNVNTQQQFSTAALPAAQNNGIQYVQTANGLVPVQAGASNYQNTAQPGIQYVQTANGLVPVQTGASNYGNFYNNGTNGWNDWQASSYLGISTPTYSAIGAPSSGNVDKALQRLSDKFYDANNREQNGDLRFYNSFMALGETDRQYIYAAAAQGYSAAAGVVADINRINVNVLGKPPINPTYSNWFGNTNNPWGTLSNPATLATATQAVTRYQTAHDNYLRANPNAAYAAAVQAGLATLTLPAEQSALVSALGTSTSSSDYRFTQMFNDIRIAGLTLPAWLTTAPTPTYSPQVQAQLTALNQQLTAAQAALAAATAALNNPSSVSAYQTNYQAALAAQTRVAQLNAQIASLQASIYQTPQTAALGNGFWNNWTQPQPWPYYRPILS